MHSGDTLPPGSRPRLTSLTRAMAKCEKYIKALTPQPVGIESRLQP